MSNFVSAKTNFPDFKKALNAIPRAAAEKCLQQAVSASAKVIQDEAHKNSPFRSGLMKGAVYRAQIKDPSNPLLRKFVVAVRSGKRSRVTKMDAKKASHVAAAKGGGLRAGGKVKLDAFYWRWIEFGHAVRKSKIGNGKSSGSAVSPRPFIRPAFEQRKRQAVDRMGEVFAKKLALIYPEFKAK